MKITATPSRTDSDFNKLMETDPKNVQFVRDENDWKKFCLDADSKNHPLEGLNKEELQEFTDSLMFNRGGLATANVNILQRKLTYIQYAAVLSSFGLDPVFASDHQGYLCESEGTCKKSEGYICTSTC